MADLGLGTLFEVKSAILPNALQADTFLDFRITALAKGCAKTFEQYCNRRFSYTVGEVEEFAADKMSYVLSRYPIVALTTLEQRSSIAGGWSTIDINNIYNARNRAGLLEFAYLMGVYSDALRVTYTGGYWYETKEPTDGGYPTAQPALTTIVPDDLKDAWYTQTQFLFERVDKLGKGALADGAAPVTDVKLLPSVQSVLDSFRRYST